MTLVTWAHRMARGRAQRKPLGTLSHLLDCPFSPAEALPCGKFHGGDYRDSGSRAPAFAEDGHPDLVKPTGSRDHLKGIAPLMTAEALDAPTTHVRLLDWVAEIAQLTQADRVVWCDGSDDEWDRLTNQLVESGALTRLDASKKQNSFWARTDPSDVARVEDRTFICSRDEADAGVTNNWMDPDEMKSVMTDLYRGSMQGPHDVRHPLLHGTAFGGATDVRCRDHRFALRRVLDAHHDAHGRRRP